MSRAYSAVCVSGSPECVETRVKCRQVRQAYETGSDGARIRRGAVESEMSEFVADNGVRVTDEMVRQWAREAESGFEGTQVEPFEGRDWEEVETELLEPRTIRVSASV